MLLYWYMKDYIKIPLRGPSGEGKYALVDAEDAHLNQFRWRLSITRTGKYVIRSTSMKINPKRPIVNLQRDVMQPSEDKVVLFKNGDHLDCRKFNLEVVTKKQKQIRDRGRRRRTAEPHMYRGVAKARQANRWTVQFQHRYMGMYRSPLEAALVYDRLAKKEYGKYAILNFP